MTARRKRTTRQVLSDDAKKARMQQWAARVNLPKKDVDELITKYGPYAYELMRKAMVEPMNIKPVVKGTFRSSSGCIKYLLENDVNAAQIAKIVKESELKVQSNLANNQIAAVAEPEQPVKTDEEKKVEAQAEADSNRLNNRVDERSTKKKTNTRNNTQQKTTTHTNQNIARPSEIKSENISVSARCIDGSCGFSTTTLCNGKPVMELPGAANDSITTTSSTREIENKHNLIGGPGHDGTNPYYGMFQTTPNGIKNYAVYALAHPDKYNKIADKLFDKTKPGFNKALKDFQAAVKKYGYTAYTSPARDRLTNYIKPDVLKNFSDLGQATATRNDMVQLQRDYACEVAARSYGIDKVANLLRAQNIDPLEVKPAVWGVIFAIGDARGNIDFYGKTWKPGIKGLFQGKTIDEINSPEMIDNIKKTYKSVYRPRAKNEMAAIDYAKDHLHEEHSIATARELSLMIGEPSLYERYLKVVASQQNTTPQPYKLAKTNTTPTVSPVQRKQSEAGRA